MKKTKIAIIGGGASGLFLADALSKYQGVTLLERGERLGRKLSATGNGQGNISNLSVREAEYFSSTGGEGLASALIKRFDERSLREFFKARGVLCFADERGRVYPTSRQASALTDALRFSLQNSGVEICLESKVVELKSAGAGYLLSVENKGETYPLYADSVVFCSGGKAAKNFGTDGSAYSLIEGLGHTVTKLYPSLVQLKTEGRETKALKGIRVSDGLVRARTPKRSLSVQGDIIFTDYGVSGDAIFRLSAFITEEIPSGECLLSLDFLPQNAEEEIFDLLREKESAFPRLEKGELLFGVVNNQLGRTILRLAQGDLKRAAALVKGFPLKVTGSLGFDYAQVTKGGVAMNEVTKELESKLAKGVFFAGECLDIDGQCGGFNLQWAYSSACAVAEVLAKRGGQVCK